MSARFRMDFRFVQASHEILFNAASSGLDVLDQNCDYEGYPEYGGP